MTETISSPRRQWLAPALIVLVVALAYSNSFQGPMLFDDIDALRDNPEIQSLIPHQYAAVQNTLTGRPVLRFTFALNYAMGGLSVEGYHATNLLIHLAACLLLFAILGRTLQLPTFNNRFDHSAPWIAAAVAIIWGVHPLNTEAVTYIVQRAESLASLFYLAVIYCLIRTTPNAANRTGWSIAAVVAALLGMGCKEIVATVPIAALIFDSVFLAGSRGRALQHRWPIYLSLISCWIILALQILSGSRGSTIGIHDQVTPLQYALTQSGVIASYLHRTLWPTQLVFDEDGWPITYSFREIGLPGSIVILLAPITLITFWRRPKIGFALIWFFLLLIPSSSFVPILTEIAAEHRMYLPMAGLIGLAVIAVWLLIPRSAALALCIAIIATLCILTHNRNSQYRTPEIIWRDTLAKRPTSARAHFNLAFALSEEAQAHPSGSPQFVDLSTQAVHEYLLSLSYRPAFATEFHLAAALADSGDLPAAENEYDRLQQAYPTSSDEWHLLRGQIRARRQEWQQARDDFQQLVAARPNDPESHYLLAIVLQQIHDPGAATEFQRTLTLSPTYKDAELRLMQVQSGQ